MTPYEQSNDLFRYPRSPEETLNYLPNWRALQAVQYYQLSIREGGEGFILPEWEADPEVISYYTFLKYRTVGNEHDDRRFFYAHDANAQNEMHGGGSRLKALLIAGCPVEIAQTVISSVQNVATYFSLFFDVGQWLENDDFVAKIAKPYITQRSEPMSLRKERLWLYAAYHFKKKGLELVMSGRVDFNDSEQEAMWKDIQGMILAQGAGFALARSSGAMATSDDFERLLAMRQSTIGEQGGGAGKTSEYDKQGALAIRRKRQSFAPNIRSFQPAILETVSQEAVKKAMARVPSGHGRTSYFID